jgi:hypothetical protein
MKLVGGEREGASATGRWDQTTGGLGWQWENEVDTQAQKGGGGGAWTLGNDLLTSGSHGI